MKNILVLCTGNSCRSQIAQAWFEQLKPQADAYQVYSAGIETHGLNANAVKYMWEEGIDISHQTSNHVDEYAHLDFAVIITVCDHAKEQCPYFSVDNATRLHQNFADPSKVNGSEEAVKEAFKVCIKNIRMFVEEFVQNQL